MKADLIIISNNVFTGRQTEAFPGCVAIKGNKIIDVCAKESVDKYIDSNTEVLEYKDELVMAGFIDAHMHYFNGVFQNSKYMNRGLFDCKSKEECVSVIKEFGKQNPDFPKISSMGWFPLSWYDPKDMPTKELLDEIEPDRPVYLLAADGHTFWLNSKALELCNITKYTQVSFGSIGKGEDGEPNGLLFDIEAEETANALAFALPEESAEEMITEFNDDLLSYGITTTTDMSVNPEPVGDFADYAKAKKLEDQGKLKIRINLYPSLGLKPDTSIVEDLRNQYKSEKLRVAGLKQFVDGVSSTYTAYLLEPYSDRDDYSGKPNYPYEVIRDCVTHANKNDFPVRLHTIGDGAIRLALDAIEFSQKTNNKRVRNSLEHLEAMAQSDIPRLAELDVVASMQPLHIPPTAYEKKVRLGDDRCKYQWPFRSILDSGVILAYGTDYPVAPYNPFESIHDSVARTDANGKEIKINPWEKTTLEEALIAYTLGGAYCIGKEDVLGTLEKGKYADVTVLSGNPFDMDIKKIKGLKSKLTVVDGEVVYKAK